MQIHIPERTAGLGPCADVKTHNGLLYVMQNNDQYPGGRLCVLTPELQLVAQYTGIGKARQIALSGDIAIVTAREDGLWILDVSQPEPKLISHYQTIEYATGATLYGNFALISCRQFGVEIIDINDPAHPKHIGMIRIGEVQSACVYEGYLYGGVWGEYNVTVVDIRDIQHPRLVTRIPLEGRGDGVLALDDRLYAVTGQHRAGIQNDRDANDPLYGKGNGLTVFDISDPEHPKKLHREEFGICYNTHADMWRPEVSDHVILCGCSSLGVFAYDKESYAPLFRLMLPINEYHRKREEDARKPENANKPVQAGPVYTADAVMGFTFLGSTVYLAGQHTDLYAIDTGKALGTCRRWNTDQIIPAGQNPLRVTPLHSAPGKQISLEQKFSPPGGTVFGLCGCGEQIAAACDLDGIFLLNRQTFEPQAQIPTENCCYDVAYANGWLAAALCQNGVLLCRKDAPEERVTIRTEMAALQVLLTKDGNYLLCSNGGSHCRIYDITNKAEPKLIAERSATHGLLYGDNFPRHTLHDGTVVMFWHGDGLVYTNPSAGDQEFHRVYYPVANGFTAFCPRDGMDTNGKDIILPLERRLYPAAHGG